MNEEKEKGLTYIREGNVDRTQTDFLDARLIYCGNTAKSQGTLLVSNRSQRRQEIDVSLEP